MARCAFGEQLCGATLKLDACTQQFHHHAGIDREPAGLACECLGQAIGRIDFLLVAADAAVDGEVFLQHVDDVSALEAGRNVELVDGISEVRADVYEQAVDRVVEETIATDIWADTSVAVLEAVGIGSDCRTGALRDRVEGQRRPCALQPDWRERIKHRIDQHLAATVGDRGFTDRVDERLLGRGIGILSESDAAPLAAGRDRPDAVGVAPDRIVVIRRKLHVVVWSAEHLQGGTGPRHDLR